MKSYNGFSGQERERAQARLRQAWRNGELPRPARCEACGQVDGIIDAHHEDYSNPLRYHETCFVCHMMIHCRFRNPDAWRAYLDLLKRGAEFGPFASRNFKLFAACFLDQDASAYVRRWGAPRPDVWLEGLTV